MKIFKTILNTIPRPWLIKLSYLARPILDIYLRGEGFVDPINGKSYRKFLSYGYGKQRNNALSPATMSLERHRLMWLYLKNETDFFTSVITKKVLHVAPEQCFLNRFKAQKNITYITTDIESPIADVKADLCNLPFEDNSFDIVFCNHVLEHITDDTKAMKELYRILKKGGFGIFQVPQDIDRVITFEDNSITDPKERARIFGQYDHVRVYGLDYFDKLRDIGFDVKEINYTTDKMVKTHALIEGEILPVCLK